MCLYHVHNDAKVNKFGFIYKKDKGLLGSPALMDRFWERK
jgi:hypothetical protein